MKLTTKFAVVIAAIITIPAVITLLIGLVYSIILMQDEEANRHVEIMKWMHNAILKAGEDADEILHTIPDGVDIAALAPDNRVLFSSLEDIETGRIIPPEDLISYLTREFPERSQLYDPRFITAQEGIKVFISVDQQTQNFANPFRFLRWIGPVFLFLLTASSIAGVVFVSSFRRSIMGLEKAACSIAGGDLDFELEPKGNDEIASLTRAFDGMREALKEELAKRSRFLMAVSHDLSTPLTTIKGYTEAITDGLAGDRKTLEKYLSIISDKTGLLEARIEELIEFVKMETGEWRLKCERVSFGDFLMQAATIYRDDAHIFKRRFSFAIDIPDTVTVEIDQGLLLRALENLFYNSLRYTKEGDEIAIDAVIEKEKIVLTIRDTGAGIEAHELERIFDPFFRGGRPNETRGFGLGLSTVKSIINAHGWDIGVTSRRGCGTAFHIGIPL
ncbi:MAG: HAMP domain-containing histidine kinase [Spirochaetales bacterium]|nr:HAMP domain-containing histidine kinase [Spirochaetales bacterium]